MHLLWVGRLIDWKHPEIAVEVAKMLQNDGIDFEMNIIGTGDQKDRLEEMIIAYGIEDYVSLLGSMSPEKVREYMVASNVFLFTSDRNEGWGAVLNEAMNSGCAVICNKAIGSVPYLITNGENGLCYRGNDAYKVYKCVKRLVRNKAFREKLSVNAYSTITNEWNSKIAADRLVLLSRHLLCGEKCSFANGICSKG